MTSRLERLAPRDDFSPVALGSPAFWALEPGISAIATLGAWPSRTELARLVFAPTPPTNVDGRPIELVPPSRGRVQRREELYDARIDGRGELITRERSYHDLMNALVWAAFPRTKAALARRQHRALVARTPETFVSLPGARTREQDALTMLDEGGALLVARVGRRGHLEDVLLADRAGVRGGKVFGPEGDELAAMVVLGHAVYEHLVCSSAPVRVAPFVVDELESDGPIERDAVDEAMASMLAAGLPQSPPRARGVSVIAEALVAGSPTSGERGPRGAELSEAL